MNEVHLHMASEYAALHKQLSESAWEWIDDGKPSRRPAEATEQIEQQADGFASQAWVASIVGLS